MASNHLPFRGGNIINSDRRTERNHIVSLGIIGLKMKLKHCQNMDWEKNLLLFCLIEIYNLSKIEKSN